MLVHQQFLIIATVFLTACGGIIQSASVSEAHKSFAAQEFRQTLSLISQAENAGDVTPETQAELTYLKAQSYSRLGEQQNAYALYRYLMEHHRDTQYGYLASTAIHFDANQ